MATEKIKFEKALEKLETIVTSLEGGELELEKSLEMFEEGIKMATICQTHLNAAEKKIEKLVKDSKGALTTEPLEKDNEGLVSEQDELPF